MIRPLNPAMAATEAPPVMEARRWVTETVLPPGLGLLNVSQAAPVEPPPLALRQAIADAALTNDAAHLYGPVLGLPELRAEIAAQWSAGYGGAVAPAQVAITQGCNQAFCAVMATLAGAGDAVILPTPWYFNHKMWLDMAGVQAVPLPTGPGLIPDAERAAALITDRTRALCWSAPTTRAARNTPPKRWPPSATWPAPAASR
jgi:aspartate/methionine/tyrosine aminotransferase